eukprot:5711658-Pyramimonas_sp.AAC.1
MTPLFSRSATGEFTNSPPKTSQAPHVRVEPLAQVGLHAVMTPLFSRSATGEFDCSPKYLRTPKKRQSREQHVKKPLGIPLNNHRRIDVSPQIILSLKGKP